MPWNARNAACFVRSPDDIVGAMRRNLDLYQMTIVKAGDFAKNIQEEEPTP